MCIRDRYQGMYRDLYQKMTFKRVQRIAKWLWKIHQPQALWKDLSMRVAMKILAVVSASLFVLEAWNILVSRFARHNSQTGMSVLLLAAVFFVVCAVGIFLRL
eukprot:TRINITY_DN18584_c0_g1_i1.p2 TRINITY_DN18584_c0_g1~~TRINITY_DN18584_c0_g1_i1.p2  ORF type:complete len:103 (+),score=24.89 TRINITY_DN18584_c0_g1_i1:165-473(+)